MIARMLSIPVALVVTLLAAQDAPSRWSPAAALAASTADADHDGAVSAAERASYVASLPLVKGSPTDVDVAALVARLVAGELDRDKDGRVAREEIEALADAVLAAAPALPSVHDLAPLVVRDAADQDHDGAVARIEWDAFAAGLDPSVSDAMLASWIAAAKTHAPADREALNAGVLLLSIESTLDADHDGRVTTAEIGALVAGLDANGDGIVSADESRPPDAAAARPWRRLDEGRASEPAETATPRIGWQRDLDDALAISRATGRPLLICVNMDGEAASESLANGRYRDREFARLVSGFVPMLVSPDQHETREHDDFGRRLPDQRFGRVICSEHVDDEPELYARWFSARRVAPRHVGVSTATSEGSVLFDVFLVNDLSVIDDTLRKHGVPIADAPDPTTLDTDALLASHDSAFRDALEARFAAAAPDERLRLAGLAMSKERDAQQPELLRMAFRDTDARVRSAAARCFATHVDRFTKRTFEWFSEAFRAAGDDPAATRELIDAVLTPDLWPANSDPASTPLLRATARNARNLARATAAFEARSTLFDARLRDAIAAAAPAGEDPGVGEDAPDAAEVEAEVERMLQSGAVDDATRERAGDRLLAAARSIIDQGGDPGTLIEDARILLKEAVAGAAPTPTALALLADADERLGDLHVAGVLAARAVNGLADRAGAPIVVRTLRTFVHARKADLFAALTEAREWPALWLADLRAAHELLLEHPLATEDDAIEALTLLNEMDLRAAQLGVAKRALARFPLSGRVHEFFRFVMLRDFGAQALERAYAELAAPSGHAPEFDWYRALAMLNAAGRDVEDRRTDDALAAYRESAQRFETCAKADPAIADSSWEWAAQALGSAADIVRARGDAAEAARIEAHKQELIDLRR